MQRRKTSIVSGAMAGILAAGVTLAVLPAPAAAQGFFESLFGGFRRAITAPARQPVVREYADPATNLYNNANRPPVHERTVEVASGPAQAFCVRSCDGHYFPLRAHAGLSAAQSCQAFCPASETHVFAGSKIDYAVRNDGARYADLPNAFIYRKKIVDNCTCNGRTAFGLAQIDVAQDPTLRPGDVVATRQGLVAYTGVRNKTADFTPVESYPHFSKSFREQLSEVKLMPPTAGERTDVTSSVSSIDAKRSARLER